MSEEEKSAKDIPACDSADEHFQRAGETLAAARVEKGMSLEQVSDRLKISINYLQALEACHYDQLPGTAFTRGYLRSYARLMDIDENHILSLFGETVQADEQVARLLQEKPLDHQTVSGGKLLVVVSIILILGFVGGSAYWWMSSDSEPVVPETPVAQETLVAESVAQTEPDVTVLPVEEINPAPQVEIEEEELASIEEPVTPAIALPEVAQENPAVPESQPIVSEDQLFVQFSGDCWVEVKDAEGTVLFSGIKTSQSGLSLTGNAPLKIKFGNVGTVTDIRFNGEPVEVNFSGSGSNIGRLTLG